MLFLIYMYKIIYHVNAFASSACWSLLTFCYFSAFSVHAATSIKSALIAPFSLLSQGFSFTFVATLFFSWSCYIAMAIHLDLFHLLNYKPFEVRNLL